MKKKSAPFSIMAFVAVLLFSGSANAFVLFSIDLSAIVSHIKAGIEQVKESTVVVKTVKTVSEVSSAIGDKVKTVQQFTNEAKDKIKEGLAEVEELKKQAEEYKKEFDQYKNYVQEKADAVKEKVETVKYLKEQAESTVQTLKDGDLVNNISSVAKSYTDQIGLPSPDELPIQIGKDKDINAEGAEDKKVPENQMIEKYQKPLDLEQQGAVSQGFRNKGMTVQTTGKDVSPVAAGAVISNKVKEPVKQDTPKGFANEAAIKAPASLTGKSIEKSQEKPVEVKGSMPALQGNIGQKIDTPKEKSQEAPVKAGGFRKSMKTSFNDHFFQSAQKKRYSLSFADLGGVSDKASLSTGKATDGSGIIPATMAEVCKLSVEELEKDKNKLRDCLRSILNSQSNNDEDSYGTSTRKLGEMRMDNAAMALAASTKAGNMSAYKDKADKDMEEQQENIDTSRDTASMTPHYTMEIAKTINDISFVRATNTAFEIMHDLNNLKIKDN